MFGFNVFFLISISYIGGISFDTTVFDGCIILGDGKNPCIPKIPNFNLDLSGQIEVDGIEDHIWAINHHAFEGCNIASIKLPNTIHQIGFSAFCNCTLLKELDLSKTFVTDIPGDMLCGATSLVSLKLPERIVSVGSKAFSYTQITELNLFHVESFDHSSLLGCYSLTSIKINGAFVFKNGSIIRNDELVFVLPQTKVYTIDSQFSSIASYCFHGSQISFLIIPNTVKRIGAFAFYNSSISHIVFEKRSNLQIIEKDAFESSQLKSITLPPSINKISHKAFFNIHQLEYADMRATQIKILPRECFSNCHNLKTLILPKELNKISAFAIPGTIISDLILNNSVTSIEPYAFAYSNIKTIDLLKTKITSLPERCFFNCNFLVSIVFPKHLKNIHTSCFDKVYSIKNVVYCGRNPIQESVFLGYPTIHTTILYPERELSSIPVQKTEKCPYPISKLNQTESELAKEQTKIRKNRKALNMNSQGEYIQTPEESDFLSKIGKIIGFFGLIFVAVITFFL